MVRRLVPFLLILACTRAERQAAPPPPKPAASSPVTELAVPAGAGAAEPFLATAGNALLASWLEPVAGTKRTMLRVARFANGAWSEPRTVLDRDDLFVNWADFPSVVADANGVLYAHWLQMSAGGKYTYDVRMATSRDGGATWSEPLLLNRDGRKAEHGFVTLVPRPGGGVAATWLDGRNMPEGGDEGHGEMSIRYAEVSARGETSAEIPLDDRTCECCTTGMAIATRGPIVFYRDRDEKEVRDIAYVRREEETWTRPRPVHADQWTVRGCPVNGPQADARGNDVAVAWFTAAGERQRAYVAFSSDGGASFAAPVQVDDGKPVGRVDVILLSGGAAGVFWIEQTAAGAEIRARRVAIDGTRGESRKVADSSTARAAGFPRVARVGDAVYAAWTDQSAASKRIRIAKVVL